MKSKKKKKNILKFKKHEKILNQLHFERQQNDRYCNLNGCVPTPYMEGKNDLIDSMIKFIEKL